MKYNGKNLTERDAREILEELKNPKIDPKVVETMKRATEIYRKHKEYELKHITDKEVEARADLPDDEWIELPADFSAVDYYKHLLKNIEDK